MSGSTSASGEPPTEGGGFSRSAGGALGRGVALIALAVLLGFALLNATDEPDQFVAAEAAEPVVPESEDPPDTTATPTTPGDTGTVAVVPTITGGAGSTPTTLRALADVRVLVANGSGVAGAAAAINQRVTSAGYTNVADPSNANPDLRGLTVTSIYFAEGFQGEAQQLAGTLSVTSSPEPLPDPPPVPELREANVVVVVGTDIAPT